MRKYSIFFYGDNSEEIQSDGVEIDINGVAVFFLVNDEGIRRLSVAFSAGNWTIIRSHTE